MNDNFESYNKEYAEAAGLKATDMPSSHHPLLESNDEILELSDLIDARRELTPADQNAVDLGADDPNLDIQEALTFPHKHRETTSADRTEALPGLGGSVRDRTDPEDSEYMTRADFEDSMDETDPDPNVGASSSESLDGLGTERAPDMSGTVTGIARGMATHLPQDVGAGGFQIRDGGDSNTGLIDEENTSETDADEDDDDSGVIPVATPNINTHNDALDATRQLG